MKFMRKSVLISIKPKWCALIASGKKTIEVRKTRPKIEPPFKCYIYCTSAQEPALINLQNLPATPYITICWNLSRKRPLEDAYWARLCNGKVIMEFICDEITEDKRGEYGIEFEKYGCVPMAEQKKYAPKQPLYGWHISALKIYVQPKELGEFRATCDREYCQDTCPQHKYWNCDMLHSGRHPIMRPPQSWMYVEENA